MTQRRRLILVGCVAFLAALVALPSAAAALPLSKNYPRTIAVIGTGGGVRLTQMQAKVLPAGRRVRVTVRLAGVSTGGPHRMMVSAAPCTVRPPQYTPSRPKCPDTATAMGHFAITEAPFSLARTLTIPRPARTPGALRVQVSPTARPAPEPGCTGNLFHLRNFCRQFPQTGELLLNGNTWAYMPGTWWGISVTVPPGIAFDRIAYNSRTAGWVATSTTAANVFTTQGFAGQPAAHTWSTPLEPAIQTVWGTDSAFGGETQARTGSRVLDYAAAIDARRLFTVTLPLPRWRPQPRNR
jgi:hypothetical protein